MLAEQIVKISL